MRTAWRWCAAAGLVAFVCSWLFGRIPGLVACGTPSALGPILTFELVRSPADVAALFGGEPCRSALIAAQKTGLWLDTLAFIPAYTAFVWLAARALVAMRVMPTARVIVAMLLVGAGCDLIENGLLAHILGGLPGDAATIGVLYWMVRTKFFLLSCATLGMGACLLYDHPNWAARIAGGGIGFGGIAGIMGMFHASRDLILGPTIAWVTLLVVALVVSVLPERWVSYGRGAFAASSPAPEAPPPDPATPSA